MVKTFTLCALIISSFTFLTYASFRYGDVNGDGKVTAHDADLVQQYILKTIDSFPSSYGILAADVNRSGDISSTDLALINRYISEIIDEFPAEPRVSIVYPENNLKVIKPADNNVPIDIELGAYASVRIGSISEVSFFKDTHLLGYGTVSNGRYVFTWNNVPSGTHTITAHAKDDQGGTRISSPITITVCPNANRPPRVNRPVVRMGPAGNVVRTCTLLVQAFDPDGSISKVEFYSGFDLIGTATTSIGNDTYRYIWNNVRPGNYTIHAVVYDNLNARTGTGKQFHNHLSLLTNIEYSNFGVGILPNGYQSYDIGLDNSIGKYGYGRYISSTGQIMVTGAGQTSNHTQDAGQFTYTPLFGDGEYVAQVESINNLNHGGRVGIMIRNGLEPNAQFVSLEMNQSGLLFGYSRSLEGEQKHCHFNVSAAFAPHWLKISRSGNQFSFYRSTNGSNWQLLSKTSIDMPEKVLSGLIVYNNQKSSKATTVFNNVSQYVPAPTCNRNGCITKKVALLVYNPIFKTNNYIR
ncbi:Ig-like domain-containing protein [Chitinispirillales bacterium ANBcel5]|nr:Ig-like domain-containing protein [Chitinispirillales bacterium ANBcel5]